MQSFAMGIQFAIKGIEDSRIINNIDARLALFKKEFQNEMNENDLQSAHKHIIKEIELALQPYGYFHSSIRPENAVKQNDKYLMTYHVSLGAPLIIKSCDIKISGEGKNGYELKKFVENFPLKIGHIFNTEEYEKTKEELFQIASNDGYIKAQFSQSRIIIKKDKTNANIIMHFDTGPRYYFGEIKFDESPYSTKFLHRMVDFKEGDPFSSTKLINLQQALSSSYFFKMVNVLPDFDHIVNRKVPIIISTLAPNKQRYKIGLGYGSVTKFRLITGLSLRRLTDTGQHFDGQLKLSSVLSSVSAKYFIPGKYPLTDEWMIGANFQKFMPKNGYSESGKASFGYARHNEKWQQNISINYLLERYKLIGEKTNLSQLLFPTFNISYIDTDDVIQPTKGLALNLKLQGAAKPFLSSTSFLQSELKGKYIFSPTTMSQVILRGDIGYTLAHDLKELPLSMRFFSGGAASIRGYSDSGIGPGKYLQVGSFEYRHQISGDWSGALFFDAGTASNHFGSHFYKSEGVGVVYHSMIGPLRFYVTKALDRPSKPYGVEFVVGPEF